jgi:hypothetical protein
MYIHSPYNLCLVYACVYVWVYQTYTRPVGILNHGSCLIVRCLAKFIADVHLWRQSLNTKCMGQADLTTIFRSKDPVFWGEIIILNFRRVVLIHFHWVSYLKFDILNFSEHILMHFLLLSYFWFWIIPQCCDPWMWTSLRLHNSSFPTIPNKHPTSCSPIIFLMMFRF